LEKTNKPLPSGAYPNQHDPRDLYHGDLPAATSGARTVPAGRAAHRKLSDYCGIFAEKTNKIGRNVESFMQSRGLLPIRRSIDETPRRNDERSTVNGDVSRNDPLPLDREARENRRRRRHIEENGRERRCNNVQRKRVEYPNNAYQDAQVGASHVHRSDETKSHRSHRRVRQYEDYVDHNDLWKRDLAARAGPSDSKPRSSINQGINDKPHYSTLPRRSRTINFEDQAYGFSDGRQRTYPKSLQNLTDLELDDDVARLPSSQDARRGARFDYYRRRDRNRNEFSSSDDSYLRLCRNLSRFDKYPRDGKYEPGQVHYERECRTFGKDTIAFIYYKTCYL
jgi:hypothetical protein